jgi:hypothetical protein
VPDSFGQQEGKIEESEVPDSTGIRRRARNQRGSKKKLLRAWANRMVSEHSPFGSRTQEYSDGRQKRGLVNIGKKSDRGRGNLVRVYFPRC